MIYKTYFDVPDGAKCRPYARGNGSFYQFADKSSWRENAVQICTNVTLDKWETEEKKIEISREELLERINYHSLSVVRTRAGKIYNDGLRQEDLICDLFGKD